MSDMVYELPIDLYKDWKELMFAIELSKYIVKELKELKGGVK